MGARDLDRSAWTAGGLLHAQGDRRSGHALDRPRCAHPAVRPRSSSPSQQFLRLQPSPCVRQLTEENTGRELSQAVGPRCGTHLCVALYPACYSTHVPPHEHSRTSHMDTHRMVGHTHTHDSCNTWTWTCTNPLPPTAYALKQSAYPESLRSVEAPQQQQPSQRPAAGLLQAHDGARARRTRRYALTLVGYW